MKLPFLYFNLGLGLLLLLSTACNQQQTALNVDSTSNEQEVELSKGRLIDTYLSANEVKHLLAIKSVFDDALCFQGTIKKTSDCYLSHAQVYSYDMVKEVGQINDGYPYSDKFDLSQVKNHADSLSFLTLNCGFQIEETEEIVHYYCLKNKGMFMNYLGELGKKNGLIQEYYNDYTETKKISDDVKKRIGSISQFEIDFSNLDHQIFYMIYHLMINEEIKAHKKISIR